VHSLCLEHLLCPLFLRLLAIQDTLLQLSLNQVEYAFEPLCQQHGILAAARLPQVYLSQAHPRRFLLQTLLKPLRLLFFVLLDARLDQLLCQIVEGAKELTSLRRHVDVVFAPLCRDFFLNHRLWHSTFFLARGSLNGELALAQEIVSL